MRSKLFPVMAMCMLFCFCFTLASLAEELKPIQLPAPKLDQSKSLAQALKDRKSTWEFAKYDLSHQTLANVLWAAFGINRPDSGKRTAPSARNRQEIDVYVAIAAGLYVYDPRGNKLMPVVAEDIRALTGTQAYAAAAPVNLVYVADLAKFGEGREADHMFISAVDTGFIGQNIYLYCASEGLGTVFRASIDREKLAQAMNLRPLQKITFAQTVGYPKEQK